MLRNALFLDVPYIVDSAIRHAEYRLNRLYAPLPCPAGTRPKLKPFVWLPAFAMFVVVLVFEAYGPTFYALCGVLGAQGVAGARQGLGLFFCALAATLFFWAARYFHGRIRRRFWKMSLPRRFFSARWLTVHLIFLLVSIAGAAPFCFFGLALLGDQEYDSCRMKALSLPDLVQLLLLTAGVIAVARGVWQPVSLRRRMAWQAGAIAVLGLALLLLPSSWTEASQLPYLHVFAVAAMGLAGLALASPWLAHLAFDPKTHRSRRLLVPALSTTELFVNDRRNPELSWRRIFGGLAVGVLEKPLQFLLLPSFAIMLVPERWLIYACGLGGLASALLITATTLTHRWNRLSQYVRRYFLLGIPFFVSISVILLALLRLSDVQYVSTLLNVAPFGVLFAWMVMAYALGWWFEYQVNGVLGARLLRMLGAKRGLQNGLVCIDVTASMPQPNPYVDRKPRYLSEHAMGEFIVFGQTDETDEKGVARKVPAFHAYPHLELFEALIGVQAADRVHEIARRVQLYFALINLLSLLGLGLLVWHMGRADRLNTAAPVVTAQRQSSVPDGSVDLAEQLLAQDEAGKQRPSAVIVAASGGGTRAALYAATVLEGLHEEGADSRVVLLSGVSGGGVAAAYFYGHRQALLEGHEQVCEMVEQSGGSVSPWTCFMSRMAMPFIGDVLQGASEWRIQGDQPLGMLLSESFERRLFQGEAAPEGQLRLGASSEVGLLLNTTITGHPLEEAPYVAATLVRAPGDTSLPCQQAQVPIAGLAGGRLVFTNLRATQAFYMADDDMPAIRMPFVVVNDPKVKLARAAALNANFPPVFPNARVDLREPAGSKADCALRSYYVTDGGATENLGLISALLALESVLPGKSSRPLRDIDIVLAEASALTFDYAQDRGFRAGMDQSRERLTGRLTLELLEKLKARVHPAQIRVHDLSLPRLFRSRGGFGTHWMFPGSVGVQRPFDLPPADPWVQRFSKVRYSASLDKKQILQLWRGLHHEGFCSSVSADGEEVRTVRQWVCGGEVQAQTPLRPDPVIKRWENLKQCLRGTCPSQDTAREAASPASDQAACPARCRAPAH
ncbi:patatin-like phospholipase family protein [Burkholderiaceae bacterium UC74_6]